MDKAHVAQVTKMGLITINNILDLLLRKVDVTGSFKSD